MLLSVVLSYRDFCHSSDFSNAMIISATCMSLQAECELVKIDINCHIQGDVVLECINLHDDMEREEMILRVMFNTAFIRSNIIMLNRNDVDMLWNAKDQFPNDFRAEVNFYRATWIALSCCCFATSITYEYTYLKID